MRIEKPDRSYSAAEPPGLYERRMRHATEVDHANSLLWIFDPSDHMGMVHYSTKRPADEALQLHFCTLGQPRNLPWDHQEKIRWPGYMTWGDRTNER